MRVSMCHCRACQRRTGSVFGAQARYNVDQVRIEGQSKTYERVGDSGERIHFAFCPDCGATVHYQILSMPDVIAIPVGGFADQDFPAPRVSVYEERKHAWVEVPEPCEHYD